MTIERENDISPSCDSGIRVREVALGRLDAGEEIKRIFASKDTIAAMRDQRKIFVPHEFMVSLREKMDDEEEGGKAFEKLLWISVKSIRGAVERFRGLGIEDEDLVTEAFYSAGVAILNWEPEESKGRNKYLSGQVFRHVSSRLRRMVTGKYHIAVTNVDVVRRYFMALDTWEEENGRPATTGDLEEIREIIRELNLTDKYADLVTQIHRGHFNIEVDSRNESGFDGNSEKIVLSKLVKKEILVLLARKLESREMEVMELCFGLRDGKAWNNEEVGTRLGVGRERIRQIRAEVQSKLQRPSVKGQLRDCLAQLICSRNSW